MATTDQARLAVNGNSIVARQQSYDKSTNIDIHNINTTVPSAGAEHSTSPQQSGGNDLSKDEVGWYFVEQYYTTMSKSPEKLYLFYNKRSQLVSGSETERLDVCIGQKAINDRIKELDIQDCKVRVTNVDAQGSGQNIVIQVIGEMSTKRQPQRKYTQTFVLAEQTNGYFVLNDIFRYIVDDDDDNEPEEEEEEEEELEQVQNDVATGYQEPTSTAVTGDPDPHTLTNSQDPSAREHDAQLVDQGLHEAVRHEDVAVTASVPLETVNGESPELENTRSAEEEATPITTEDDEASFHSEPDTIEALTEEDAKQPEKPAAPEPTPAASPPKQKPTQPTGTLASALPKTWATMAAAANRNRISPVGPTQIQAHNPSVHAPKPVSTTQPQTPSTSAVQESEQPSTPQSSGSEWQTAARDHGKKQARPQSSSAPAENSRAYMKNISENVTVDMIRNVLSRHGEVTYCDINRQKNCAFADFSTSAGYQAAVNANPHDVGGERVIVEERRVRPQSFNPFAPRGSMSSRGRGGPYGKDGGRGSFPSRGRGNAARGRGVSQAA